MNIGIVVYSQTGHTLEVCETLRDRLAGQGHEVQVERVTVVGERTPKTQTFELEAVPEIGSFDAVVVASYVEAFSLCQVMGRYLKQIKPLEGKRVACLVTQQFPYPWMGGSRAVRQMKKLCHARGATIAGSAVVNWAKSRREKTMAQAIDRLGGLF